VSEVRLGKVVRAIGLKGLLAVAGSEGALARLATVTLRRPGAAGRTYRVVMARPQGKVWALGVEGVGRREEAEALVGSEVVASREELGDAGDGVHYWADLEGLPVVTVAGEELGSVTGLQPTGAVDVLVVTGRRGEVLLPLAPYVTVDRAARRVVVDPPEGLLELARGGEEEGSGGG
jgi:16S rRNA processing protein RimM